GRQFPEGCGGGRGGQGAGGDRLARAGGDRSTGILHSSGGAAETGNGETKRARGRTVFQDHARPGARRGSGARGCDQGRITESGTAAATAGSAVGLVERAAGFFGFDFS